MFVALFLVACNFEFMLVFFVEVEVLVVVVVAIVVTPHDGGCGWYHVILFIALAFQASSHFL